MKKIIILISIVLVSSSLFALSLTPSIHCKTNNEVTAIYGSLGLNQSFKELELNLDLNIGYDIKSDKAYNNMLLGYGLNFDWGDISLTHVIGKDIETNFVINFNSLI